MFSARPSVRPSLRPLADDTSYLLQKNLASVKIVKTEFNANLYLVGFPHF